MNEDKNMVGDASVIAVEMVRDTTAYSTLPRMSTFPVMLVGGGQAVEAPAPVSAPVVAPVAADRILSVNLNDELMGKLGPELRLLVYVIRKCGAGNSCQLMSGEIVEGLHVHRNTYVNWFSSLEQLGLVIVETRNGSNGLAVRLNTDVIKSSGVFERTRASVGQLNDAVSGMKQLNDHIVSILFARLTGIKEILG